MRLLRKITDLVDKDVAAHSKPLSMFVAVIPCLPFMAYVDGAPFDGHPAFAGLALATSFCWLAFVMWRILRHTRSKLEGFGYVVGSARFWRLILGTICLVAAVAAVLMWLENRVG